MATTTTTNTECLRIADQLRRAFEGNAWHGPALGEILQGISAREAAARPIAAAHSIWELITHIEAWERVSLAGISGTPFPKSLEEEQNFPKAIDPSEAAWQRSTASLMQTNQSLCLAIAAFGDDRLAETVPGRKYDFRQLFFGLTQHALYHAGQAALLKKAIQTPA